MGFLKECPLTRDDVGFATPIPDNLEKIKQGEGEQTESSEQKVSEDEMLF